MSPTEIPTPVKIASTIVSADIATVKPVTDKGKPSNDLVFVGKLPRKKECPGITYEIQPGQHIQEEPVFITISNMEFPDGTIRPCQLFFQSATETHGSWVDLLARTYSRVWQEARIDFPAWTVKKLLQTTDARGGYYAADVGFVKSLGHHIGLILEKHCLSLGIKIREKIPENIQRILATKQIEAEKLGIKGTLCPKCSHKKVVRLDGCDTCLECGYSKCG